MSNLTHKKVLLGITGGIAAYKICELIRLLISAGAEVRVMVTPNALQFVTPVTLEALSRNPLISEEFPVGIGNTISHIELADWADAILIAPASANTIAKLRYGFADNLLTTTMLVANRPYLIAPAMNSQMWDNQATQENVNILKDRGVWVIGPEYGLMAAKSEKVGFGRMTEPSDLFLTIERYLDFKDYFHKKNVLVTAGGTSEPIDRIRYISNRSTGTLGIHIAEQFHRSNANVTLLLSESANSTPYGIHTLRFNSVDSLNQLLVEHLAKMEVWIMAAAVSDRKPMNQYTGKVKKQDLGDFLQWEPTVDLLATHSKLNTSCFTIGFALEETWDETVAFDKLNVKNSNAIVWNNPLKDDTGFGEMPLEAKLIEKNKWTDWGKLERIDLAKKIVQYCIENVN